jgi:hypothetical protein
VEKNHQGKPAIVDETPEKQPGCICHKASKVSTGGGKCAMRGGFQRFYPVYQ